MFCRVTAFLVVCLVLIFGQAEAKCSTCTAYDGSGQICKTLEIRCNAVLDCADGLDESDCGLNVCAKNGGVYCESDQLDVVKRLCVKRCDGVKQCVDGQDEIGC
ncbi:uncharacterized protein LOC141915197 [Tubulanus polymorphus]|uniref:uncharacterized protein LOC141915197 n=1 Tax=Tubulanus polymorphus TaxID=672921 RepID=UPI003DA27510